MFYLAWRVMKKLHDQIEMNFLVAGHTKFSCDALFGVIKKKFRLTHVSSLQDIVKVWLLAEKVDKVSGCKKSFNVVSCCFLFYQATTVYQVVERSAQPNKAQLVGTQDGETLVPVYNWTDFFTAVKKIPKILENHQFTFTKDRPGTLQ